jgi:hypothetical protein
MKMRTGVSALPSCINDECEPLIHTPAYALTAARFPAFALACYVRPFT